MKKKIIIIIILLGVVFFKYYEEELSVFPYYLGAIVNSVLNQGGFDIVEVSKDEWEFALKAFQERIVDRHNLKELGDSVNSSRDYLQINNNWFIALYSSEMMEVFIINRMLVIIKVAYYTIHGYLMVMGCF